MCRFALFYYSLDNAIDGRLEELCDLRTIHHDIFEPICWTAGKSSFLPRNFHLSKPNVSRFIVVASPSKFDVLWFINCPKSGLCSLVEASRYVVNVILKFRV